MAKLTSDNEAEIIEKDSNESPRSEREQQAFQSADVGSSTALDDEEIDDDDVNVLPGTGGPDDAGDVEVDPDELNL